MNDGIVRVNDEQKKKKNLQKLLYDYYYYGNTEFCLHEYQDDFIISFFVDTLVSLHSSFHEWRFCYDYV